LVFICVSGKQGAENPWAARGIEAEILFYRGAIKKIGAESPAGRIFVPATRIQKYCSPMQPGFFCGPAAKKRAQIPNYK
jgi:hypothetical protein